MAQQLQKVFSIKLSYILQPNQHVFWKMQLATQILFLTISQILSCILEYIHCYIKIASINTKLNLEIGYPPLYSRKIWSCNRSETDSINYSIESYDWSYLFQCKNLHEQVELFSKTLLNAFHNFIPNKINLCDDKDFLYKDHLSFDKRKLI